MPDLDHANDERHCFECGTSFAGSVAHCPNCRKPWLAPSLQAGEIARTLDVLRAAHEQGDISERPYDAIREALEEMLARTPEQRAFTQPTAPEATPTDVPSGTQPANPVSAEAGFVDISSGPSHPHMAAPIESEPVFTSATKAAPAHRQAKVERPPRPPGPPIGDIVTAWAAKRQADILLYLGAFLLTAAALSFVAYQGDAVSPILQFLVVTAYTATFLAAGVLLQRSERIREAGPVFLALGAVLVPIDFFALRAATTGGQLPADVATLIGSSSCSLLYVTLMVRGYGKYYVMPAIPSAMLAWGALGSVLGVSAEWFGAWYELPAAAAWVTASAMSWKVAPLIRRGAVTTSFVALNYSFGASILDGTNEWVLPVTFLIITAGLAGGLRFRLSNMALAILPLAASLAGATSIHAAWSPDYAWHALLAALAGSGYLLVAEFDGSRARPVWRGAALSMWMLALGGAHLAVAIDEPARFALPAVYALVLGGAAGGVLRWQLAWREGVVVIPPVAAGLGASLLWAWFDMPLEWLPAFAMAAGGGFLICAHIDTQYRARWQWFALAVGGAAGAISLGVAALPEETVDTTPWQVPVTAALALASATAGVVRWRFAWRPGVTVVSPLATATLAALLWAWVDMPLEWLPGFATAAGAGFLLIADIDRQCRDAWQWSGLIVGGGAAAVSLQIASLPEETVLTTPWQLPATAGLGLLAVAAGVARWRREWRPGIASLPPLAAAAPAALLWAWVDMPLEWLPAFGMVAAGGVLFTAHVDLTYRDRWQWAALIGGAIAAVASLWVASLPADTLMPTPWQLPVTAAVALFPVVAGAARWRLHWRPGVATLSPLSAATTAALLWAWVDMPLEWLPAFAAVGASGFLIVAEWDTSMRQDWRRAALWAGAAAVIGAQMFAIRDDPGVRAQLPATYVLVLAAATADGFRRRDQWMLMVPALAAALGISTLWWLDVEVSWWAAPPTAIGLAIALANALWTRHSTLRKVGWAYATLMAGTPAVVFANSHYGSNAAGLTVNVMAALAVGIAAIGSNGSLGRLAFPGPLRTRALQRESEALLLAYASGALTFAAAGHANAILGIADASRTWAFVAVASIAWAAVALLGRERLLMLSLTPIAAAGFALAAAVAAESAGLMTAVLLIATVFPALAFSTTRSWSLWLVAFAFAALTARAVWNWREFDIATLPLAYAGMAAILWAVLFAVRRYGPLRSERDTAIQALSWGPWMLAAATAGLVLNDSADQLASGAAIETTQEWTLAAVVVAAVSAAVIGEAIKVRLRVVLIAGSVGLLLSMLMLIATVEPGNVQAFTVPIGLYLLILGLTFRKSEPLFGPHMAAHEALIVAGVLSLVLPPAAQSFQQGGGRYGFEVLGLGLAFLATGLVIHARWLMPAGVLCLTGVAIRWLTGGYVTVPYWLILGILGTLSIGIGTIVLFERDSWDMTKDRITRWWLDGFGNPA